MVDIQDNVYIDRVKPYNPSGRLQTEEESIAMVERLDEFLANHRVTCQHYTGDQFGYNKLVEDVIQKIGKGE